MQNTKTESSSIRSAPALLAGMRQSLNEHWPEYFMEAACLGLFMVSACVFGVLLEHPNSGVHQAIPNAVVRRALMGLAMGVTAIGLICSPWGKRSGAHMNPAVTLTFLSLRKISSWDALYYVAFQFVGGTAGVLLSGWVIGPSLGDAAINYVVTVPGPLGVPAAFWAEALISFVMMGTILIASNVRALSRMTPYFAGALLAIFITLEAPYSGMSLNPARTAGSAAVAGECTGLWLYFAAPTLAMFAAGQIYRTLRGSKRVFCAKLHHDNGKRCIFRCQYPSLLKGHSQS
jgi:aquaporin Z